MKFAPIQPHDYPAIAAAERLRRRSAAKRAGWDAAARAADDADWAAIEAFDFHLVEIRAPDDRPDTPARQQAERLTAIAARTATTAIRRHAAEGAPPGEAEARAYKLLNLSRRMARCTGQPHPTLGEIRADPTKRKAA